MKNMFLILLLSIGINSYASEQSIEANKNAFIVTNRKEDILEIGSLLNNAIKAIYNAIPKENLDQDRVEKEMKAISNVFSDSNTIEESLFASKLNDNEVKAVLILLKKLATIQELQYVPMMISMLIAKAKDFTAQNKDAINAGLKGVMSSCESLAENLNKTN